MVTFHSGKSFEFGLAQRLKNKFTQNLKLTLFTHPHEHKGRRVRKLKIDFYSRKILWKSMVIGRARWNLGDFFAISAQNCVKNLRIQAQLFWDYHN